MPRKRFPYYPIYLDIENHDVLIVGGGQVCARKAETMMRYGARVTVVTPSATGEIQAWAREGKLRLELRPYEKGQLEGRSLVIASTDDRCVNARVARDCRRLRIPVNVVDVTHLCEFIVPSIFEQGSIQIATSTGGKSPALSRRIRETLQNVIGPEFDEVNEVLGSLRPEAKKLLPTDRERKRFFEGILERGVIDLLRDGRRREAYEIIASQCRDAGVPLSAEVRRGLERE